MFECLNTQFSFVDLDALKCFEQVEFRDHCHSAELFVSSHLDISTKSITDIVASIIVNTSAGKAAEKEKLKECQII
jgi:hypothetical protein